MSENVSKLEELIEQAIYDVAVDHPMWIGADGEPLDYLPEREARICDFTRAAADAVAKVHHAECVAPLDQIEGGA